MHLIYHTNRLDLKILRPGQEHLVLDFYERNRSFLEPLEPARSDKFYTPDYQRASLSYEYNSFIKFSYLRFWIFLHDDPSAPIGTVCFSNFLKGAFCSCMVGYKLDQHACHNGYMYETLALLVPLVCREYHIHRIEAMVLPDNKSSIHLLQKLGFEKEGYLRSFALINGQWKDHLLYTFLSQTP